MVVIGINKKRLTTLCVLLLIIALCCFAYTPLMKNVVYPCKYKEIVEEAAHKNNVDPRLIYSVMKAESGFNERAVSVKGAKGLMQLMDETAEWIYQQSGMDDGADIYSPEVNIHAGTWYIAKLMRDNEGNMVAALASYNAGGSNVEKWKAAAGTDHIETGDIQFGETGRYVNKILNYYDKYKKLYR